MQVGLRRTTINSCVCILSSLLFNLYAIVYILFITYLHIIVSCIHLFKYAKRDHHPIQPPSRVITIGWISLKFLTTFILKDLSVCESCIISKMTKRPPLFLQGLGTKECLELVNIDEYEPFCVYAWKAWVFDHFTVKYSRFGYVDRKSDSLDKFIEFKVELDNLLGKHIMAL